MNQNCSKGFKTADLSSSVGSSNTGGTGGGGGGGIPPIVGANEVSHFTMGGYQVPYIVGRTFDPTNYLTTNIPTPGTGNTYYVDGTNGNDSNNGTTVATAFKTIAKGKSLINAGDNLYIRKGIYREKIQFAYHDGTAQNRILISAYGDGPVVLDSSHVFNTWNLDSGSVYKTTGLAAIPHDDTGAAFLPGAVIVNDTPLIPALSRATMAAGTWFFDGNDTLYVWTPTNANPSTTDLGVLQNFSSSSNDQYAIQLYESHYFTFYGLTVRYSRGDGIQAPETTNVINCITKFNGKDGVSIGSGQIINNLGFFNTMQNWPRGYNNFSSGGWAGAFNSLGVAAVMTGNINFHSGGEGFTMADGTMSNNINVDSFSVGYYIMTYGSVPTGATGVDMNHNLEICDPLDMHEYYTGTASAVSFDVKKRMLADGITTGNEFVSTGGIKNVMMTNNIIIGCKKGYNHNQEGSPQSGIQNMQFLNNTIMLPAATFIDPNYPVIGINLPYNGGMNSGSVFRNNIIYVGNSQDQVLSVDPSGSAPSLAGAFQGLTLDHNLYFNPGATVNFFEGYPIHSYTFAQYEALAGFTHGAGDMWIDPLFIDATAYTTDGAVLQNGSPAVGVGVNTNLNTDFWYKTRTGAYDLGALQH